MRVSEGEGEGEGEVKDEVNKEKEVYTRPLPLTSCQEDRLGLDYTVLCYG